MLRVLGLIFFSAMPLVFGYIAAHAFRVQYHARTSLQRARAMDEVLVAGFFFLLCSLLCGLAWRAWWPLQ